MRSNLPTYELAAPPDLAGALDLLATGDYRPFAGGTDLMVLAEAGKLPHRQWVSLWHLDELRGIRPTDEGGVEIGALTTYADVRRSDLLNRSWPLLARAAAETGGLAIQNRGTLGGNVANASPAADTPPVLLVYGAELELVSAAGSRRVPYGAFHRGYKQMDLGAGELIRAIHLPPRDGAAWRDTYHKVGTRKAQAISKLCLAAAVRLEGDVVAEARIAFGAVAPVPLRCPGAEAALRGRRLGREAIAAAQQALATEIAPIDDFRSTERYRRRVAQNLLVELL
jgi:CO/xanthine dehydrogenase FAD-binding subunit